MLGKIIGIALVGLTQFILWIVLTVLIQTVTVNVLFKDQLADTAKQNAQVEMVNKDDLGAGIDKMQKVKSPLSLIHI